MSDALGAGAQAVKKKIQDFNESAKMRLLAGAGSKTEGGNKKIPNPPRTMAQPGYGDGENDKPVDISGEAEPLAWKAKDEFGRPLCTLAHSKEGSA